MTCSAARSFSSRLVIGVFAVSKQDPETTNDYCNRYKYPDGRKDVVGNDCCHKKNDRYQKPSAKFF